jgi:NitT/TauT family transport system permease protein
LVATIGAVLIALLFAQFKWLERAFLPFAVVLQVTPIIAIAPLLLIYCTPAAAVLLCAFLVAFFPILANTALGLASAERNLRDLFALYGASRWQALWLLKMPAALPLFLTGLRIGGGLALIGAIAAELTAGSQGSHTGLAVRIVEASYRLNIPRMFAALALVALTGIVIYAALAALSRWALRHWHESATDAA